MTLSICTYSFIPLRSEPSERAELISQILFGDVFEVVNIQDNWAEVICRFDGYHGWIDSKLIEDLTNSEVEQWESGEKWIVPQPFTEVICEPEKNSLIIPGGSCIVFNGSDRNSFIIGSNEYYLVSGAKKINCKNIDDIAKAFINSPYLWGGKTFMGIDCSGFTQVIHRIVGHDLPRDASQQVELGTTISFVEEAESGDLAFFDNEEGMITHVGICMGGGEIIHASGSVRIDKFDHIGIFNVQKGIYSHKLRVIKRIFEQ